MASSAPTANAEETAVSPRMNVLDRHIAVTRDLLTADEALAVMGDFAPGYVPPWAEDLVVMGEHRAARAALLRALDVVISLSLLVVLCPVILLLAIVIRLDSAGPAIFKQLRLGKDAHGFTFYKFRTLYRDATERFPELYAYDYTGEQVRTMRFKLEDDPRLTRVGRWLRKTSLDELPNLVNVLKGDMTLVGPRPEIPEMYKYYERWQCMKWSVKPGVTGYAQVQGRGYLSFQETIYWDVRFVLEQSLSTYVRVLMRTVWTVGKGIGAF